MEEWDMCTLMTWRAVIYYMKMKMQRGGISVAFPFSKTTSWLAYLRVDILPTQLN